MHTGAANTPSSSQSVPPPSVPEASAPTRRMSLRLKLTLWMLVIFIVIQVSLALVLQLYQTRSIETYFNDRLASRLGLAADRIRPMLPNVPDQELDKLVREQAKMVAAIDLAFHLLDDRGELIATSRRPGVELSPENTGHLLSGGTPHALLLPGAALGGGPREDVAARAAAIRLDGPDGRSYIFMVVDNDLFAQQMLALLTRIVLITIPIGIVATGVAAYLISGIAVRPLLHITAAARRLAPESITKHVEVPPLAAEVAAVREELEKARKRIEAGFATQERFMSNVSHELKTPIATILTEIQTLKLDGVPQQVRDFIRSESEELEKLAQMVDSFLLLTRVRHGKVQVPAAAHCLVRDVLMDSYSTSASFAKQHSIRIDLQLPEGPDADAAVIGNCDLLRIIFDNIIRNAVRFSPTGSIITIRTWIDGDDIHISVRDRGNGIPPEVLPRIFDRFAQASDEQRRGRGHGLGLEIALGVAELHAGGITAANCTDGHGGCEFVVRLPLLKPDHPALPLNA